LHDNKSFSYSKKELTKYKKGLGVSINLFLDITKDRNDSYVYLFDDNVLSKKIVEEFYKKIKEVDKLDINVIRYVTSEINEKGKVN
jgi:hypothetical protein